MLNENQNEFSNKMIRLNADNICIIMNNKANKELYHQPIFLHSALTPLT